MDAFLRDVALLFIGGVLGPVVLRAIRLPKTVERARRYVDRRAKDHQTWVDRNYEDMLEEFGRVDGAMNERGILGSSIHLLERERVRRRYLRELEDEQRSFIRESEDAFDGFGPLERWYTKRILKKPVRPSTETAVVDEAWKKFKEASN